MSSVSTSILPRKRSCSAVTRKPSVRLWNAVSLPLGIGHIRTRTTTSDTALTLFAALNYLDGKLISLNSGTPMWSGCPQADRGNTQVAGQVATTVLISMSGHFTPTGSSWLNLVERFFADLTSEFATAAFAASPNWFAPSNPIWPTATRSLNATHGIQKAKQSSPRFNEPKRLWPTLIN